jgi:hypothetical protein
MSGLNQLMRPGRLRVVLVCAAFSAGAALAGCGSGGSGSSTSTATATSAIHSTTSSTTSSATGHKHAKRSERHRPRRPRLPAVGQTQQLTAYGSMLHVTVTKVIDPLPYHGANLVPGTRPVGVEVRIAVVAGATYDSTASGDWSLQLTPASAQATPLSVNSGVCETQLVDFESAIYGGDVRPGCVAFSLPAHAKIAAVVFAPHSNAAKAVRWR